MSEFGFYLFYYRCAVCGEIMALSDFIVITKDDDMSAITRALTSNGTVLLDDYAVTEGDVVRLDKTLNAHADRIVYTGTLEYDHDSGNDDDDLNGMETFMTYVGMKWVSPADVPVHIVEHVNAIMAERRQRI